MTGGLKPRQRGRRWQVVCQAALLAMGVDTIARQAGEDGDDIVILTACGGRWSVELTDRADIPTGALGTKVDQAVRQAEGPRWFGYRTGIVWVKRRGKADPMDGFVVMRARDFWERVA